MSDISVLLRIIEGQPKKHRYFHMKTIDEVTRSIVCVDCGKTIFSNFIDGDEDRPDRWTGWGKCTKDNK